ncbi:probable helicase MAGATAMA 3 [Phalaenopsis equestris]|uniref:probable helicase MAGATAMA 3 n=1 Tax=Phalaenopsis equestris TaxID=78828 RepID=UPI0009E4B142|nr:probable helicase MAGATAMA 3 [Phalaenopsis equestris]
MAIERSAPANSFSITKLSRFQRIVLGWDYIRLLRESGKNNGREGLKHVKNTFDSVEDYIGVFEPLILEELKSQIVQGKDDEEASDWQRGAVASFQEVDEFHKLSLAVLDDFRENVSENDLLLLSKEKFQEGEAPNAYAFALVDHRGGKETLRVLTYLCGEVKQLDKMEVESSPRLSKMLSIFKTKESFVWILKICSLSTIIREYIAMHSIAHLPFKDLILSASPKSYCTTSEGQTWNVPKPLMDHLRDCLNSSQLDAINACLSHRPFVLIQGPPGTGKTQTIIGLLSAILHSSPTSLHSNSGSFYVKQRPVMSIKERHNHWRKASPWLTGLSPRDLIRPIDGDDGFYPVGNELKPEIVKSNRKYRMHVLVCAPSNSALDEIVLRVLYGGIHDENNHVYNPKIVRVGVQPHHLVQAVSMDYLVEQKLATMDLSTSTGRKSGESMNRDMIRDSIIDDSAIVFSTLSFNGSSLFSRTKDIFDVVIIDEAAQAVEPATLISLAHGSRQVFLVGDPVQLPATVISPTAERFGYGTSLFKRFQEAGFPVHLLKTQYRMHPEISIFPSKEFYAGSLEDGELLSKSTERTWHEYRCFGPFCFFDIDGVECQPSGTGSWVNEDEIEFIVLMYHKLASQYSTLKSISQLAIISPYRYQVKFLREKFRATFGEKYDQSVEINTVDGFQGREKDVAIFSCVRSNGKNGKNHIGFVSDFRRMNVGITRARSSILVVGSASTLMQDEHWRNLVNSAKERDCYFKVSKPYASFFNDTNLNTFRVRSKMEKKIQELNGFVGLTELITDQMDVVNEGFEEDGMDADYGGFDGE